MANLCFTGSYDHSLDGKGRVIIPASYREALGENFTITLNPERSAIAIYPEAVWQGQTERFSHIDPMDKRGMRFLRYIMSVSYAENSMDAQGRVLIPTKLRGLAGLTRDIKIVGVGSYIEIWDATAFDDWESGALEDMDDATDYIREQYPTFRG